MSKEKKPFGYYKDEWTRKQFLESKTKPELIEFYNDMRRSFLFGIVFLGICVLILLLLMPLTPAFTLLSTAVDNTQVIGENYCQDVYGEHLIDLEYDNNELVAIQCENHGKLVGEPYGRG